MGALGAAGRKRRGFKEGGLAYDEMTSQGFVNTRSHKFQHFYAPVGQLYHAPSRRIS